MFELRECDPLLMTNMRDSTSTHDSSLDRSNTSSGNDSLRFTLKGLGWAVRRDAEFTLFSFSWILFASFFANEMKAFMSANVRASYSFPSSQWCSKSFTVFLGISSR